MNGVGFAEADNNMNDFILKYQQSRKTAVNEDNSDEIGNCWNMNDCL